MAANLKFPLSTEVPAVYETSGVDAVVLISRKEDAPKAFKKFSDEIKQALEQLVATTPVSPLSGGSSTTWVSAPAGYVKVALILTPNDCSRHNCPTRPDAIASHWGSICNSIVSGHHAQGSVQRDPAVHEEKRARTTLSANRPLQAVVVSVAPNSTTQTPQQHAYAVSCALARGLPVYSAKTSRARTPEGYDQGDVSVVFLNQAGEQVAGDAASAVLHSASAGGVQKAAALVDMPPNILTTTEFADIAQKRVETLNDDRVKCEIIRGEELREQGFGGLYGCGRAAEHPPAMVILTYKGDASASPKACWVGKGIVYDTGGLSIKSKTGMPGMKRDMGGAAAIMEAFFAVTAIQPEIHIVAILCLAENAVGPLATRPDDIHTFYSGKTVEINNTDAEGRLVLGDGVAYATKHLNPATVVDMCTLTGAQGVATGQHIAAIMSSDEALEGMALVAGRGCGDLCHAMPYAPEFFTSEFESKVADMKNSVKNRSNAQVSCAGQFIGNHIDFTTYKGNWLHIDMAAPVQKNERATGFGVALLLSMFVASRHLGHDF
eukprot:m.200332 g.200332  ORF g.200332 m.200332 type:complete len:549 (-) comp18787_c0_seq2:167-1813(-)